MADRLRYARERATDAWSGLIAEGAAYIRMALEPEVQRVMLLDGPAVLGDPSSWPGEQACLEITKNTMGILQRDGALRRIDIDAAARMFNGAARTAALWVAAADEPTSVLDHAIDTFKAMAEGLRTYPVDT